MSRPLYFTPTGMARIEQQKQVLLSQLKEAQTRKGTEAGDAHDWHDNAGYEQAQRDEAQINGQLAAINEKIARMVVVRSVSPNVSRLRLGQVAVLNVAGETKTYVIGGFEDSDPEADLPVISYLAPLVKDLMGKEEGETVTVTIAGKAARVTLEKIRLPD